MQGVEARDSDFRGADVEQVNWGGAYFDGIGLPPPVPPHLPTTDEILADPKRFLPPEQSKGNGQGHGKSRKM